MPTSPESAVKKLARLPPNTICPNCGTTSKYGFSTICIKYLTFVCNACKSSHQAISHRCKSLTMSSWDQGEVLKLKKHGNDYARRVWLANAPPVGVGGRPKEGDDINLFKRFVVEVYENRRYYREPDAADGVGGGGDGGVGVVAASQSLPPSARHNRNHASNPNRAPPPPPKRAPPMPAPTPTPAAAVDLLDFGAFDISTAPAPTPSSSQPAITTTAAAAAASWTNTITATSTADADPFFDPFQNNINSSANNHQMNANA
ncbi:hypothetical protein ACHAXR_010568, partial [Thalassiosira sp. AJA248-18]